MENHEETRFKLTNSWLNKLKSAAKNKTGTTLRITQKNFQNEELPHDLFLTTRQKIKIKKVNMLTDIKLSKAQLSKIIKLCEFLGALLGKLARTLIKVGVALAETF